jgi:hypothetical protein
MSYELLTPILRHFLQALGGFLVAVGYMEESMLDPFIGVGLNVAAFAWWAFDRWRASWPVAPVEGEDDFTGGEV